MSSETCRGDGQSLLESCTPPSDMSTSTAAAAAADTGGAKWSIDANDPATGDSNPPLRLAVSAIAIVFRGTDDGGDVDRTAGYIPSRPAFIRAHVRERERERE